MKKKESDRSIRRLLKSTAIGLFVLAFIYLGFANLYMWALDLTIDEFLVIQADSVTLIVLVIGGSLLHITHFIIREII